MMSLHSNTSCSGSPGAVRLRVMTYNIRHGLGMDDVVDVARIADVIRKHHPDLVALQEVDDGLARSGGVSQWRELGRLSGMHATFGRAAVIHGGDYGNAVLSRFPFVDVTNHPLPSTGDNEPRAALACRVAPVPGREVILVSTHFDFQKDSLDRRLQSEAVDRLFRDAAAPVVLAGDFNAPLTDPSLAALQTGWTNTAGDDFVPTFPAESPTVRIDHILVAPSGSWATESTVVPEEPTASDHRPVIADLLLA